jgi:hypothetical protein
LKLKGQGFNGILEIQQNFQQFLNGITKEESRYACNDGRIAPGLGVFSPKGSTLKGACCKIWSVK